MYSMWIIIEHLKYLLKELLLHVAAFSDLLAWCYCGVNFTLFLFPVFVRFGKWNSFADLHGAPGRKESQEEGGTGKSIGSFHIQSFVKSWPATALLRTLRCGLYWSRHICCSHTWGQASKGKSCKLFMSWLKPLILHGLSSGFWSNN